DGASPPPPGPARWALRLGRLANRGGGWFTSFVAPSAHGVGPPSGVGASVLERTPFPLLQHDLRALVRAAAGAGFSLAVPPEDFDRVHTIDFAQAEVGPRVVAAQVAVTRVDPPYPALLAGPDRDLGAVGVTLQGRVDGAN